MTDPAVELARKRKKEKKERPYFVPTEFQPEQPTFLERVGRGVADTAQGLSQLGAYLSPDLAVGFSNLLSGRNAETPEQMNRWATQDVEMFDRGNVAAQDNLLGLDPARIAGNVASVAPAALAAPQSLGGAAALGAGTAATQFVPGENFAAGKALQTGLGALGGAAGYGLAKGIGNVAGRIGARFARLGDSAKQKVLAAVETIIKREGGDQFDPSVVTRMLDDAAAQMDQHGDLDPEALMRLARFKRVGLEGDTGPTRAMVTRDPTDWVEESNASKLLNQRGMANPVQQRKEAINQLLMDRAEQIGQIGAPIEGQAGDVVMDTVQRVGQQSQRQVSGLYKAVERAPGKSQIIADPERFIDDLTNTYVSFTGPAGQSDIPPGVLRQLTAFTDNPQTAPTVENLAGFWKNINKQGMPPGAAGAALNELRYATRAAVDRTARAGGENAKALREASLAAARRFAWIRGPANRPTKLVQSIIDSEISAEQVSKRLINGSTAELDHLRRFLVEFAPEGTNGAQAWEQVRRHAARGIVDKLTGTMDERSWVNLNPNAAMKMWTDLGAKRNLFFEPEEYQAIDDLLRATMDMTRVPRGAAVNFSNTTPALFNVLSRMNNIPILRYPAQMLAGAMRIGEGTIEAMQATQAAQRALTPFAPSASAPVTRAVERATIVPGSMAAGDVR